MTEELTKAAQQALEALEEARDEVEAAKQQAAQLAGYPRTDARHASYVAQLEKHDAAIDALRSALTQRPAAQTEREAFEAEMRCEETWGHRSLKKRPDGRYQNWQVDVMWDVWQRRAALPAPQQATPATACGKGCACLTQCGDYYDHHGQATTDPVGEPDAWLRQAKQGPGVHDPLVILGAARPTGYVAAYRPVAYCDTRPAPGVPDDLATIAGLHTSVGHLSRLIDEQTMLLARAMQAMKKLHESASPDDGPDLNAIIPAGAFHEFVDDNAALRYAIAQSPISIDAAAAILATAQAKGGV